MRWSRIIAEVAKLAGIFLLIPAALVGLLRSDSVLPILIYLQLLLIWMQAEISLRQNALFAAQFEPSFNITVSASGPLALTIENVSENPAYSVTVTRLLDARYTPLNPKEWQDKVKCDRIATSAPHEKQQLCVVTDRAFEERLRAHGASLEVSYFDRQGEWQTLTISFLGDGQLLVIPSGSRPPGVLLNTFEAVSSTWRILRFRRSLKNKIKVSESSVRGV
jgi:hypothetical protein